MSYLQSFQVFPNIPKQLLFLEELARNFWWCWRLDAVELFRRIDAKLWQESKRKPFKRRRSCVVKSNILKTNPFVR
jgi:starch phosphorylase